jgi:hypothetical protein
MAWPPGEHTEVLIAQANQLLTDVSVVRYDVSLNRALIELEGSGLVIASSSRKFISLMAVCVMPTPF